MKRKNLKSLQSLGGMSAEIQESMSNFKVIVAFNRLDYFRSNSRRPTTRNFAASVAAGFANNMFMPIYGLAFNLAQLLVLAYGFYLIAAGKLTVGLLIGFLLYVNSFYMPLRQLATVWSSFQLALAASTASPRCSRSSRTCRSWPRRPSRIRVRVLQFGKVHFSIPAARKCCATSRFALEKGKTLRAGRAHRRRQDHDGVADGPALRSDRRDGVARRPRHPLVPPDERARKDRLHPSGAVPLHRHGRATTSSTATSDYAELLRRRSSRHVLDEAISPACSRASRRGSRRRSSSSGDGISLGQKQLIAFMRAVLRSPEILILDEATANIDTVTEQLLEEILAKLPADTTKVIIAHRLNTIENADEIFFINAGEITPAGSMEHALDMLLHGKRAS